MLPYYILILTPCLPLLKYKGKQGTKKALWFFFVILTILVALRNIDIGNDTRGYYYIFSQDSPMSFAEILKTAREPFFGILTKLLSYISSDYQIYLAILALITIIPIIYVYVTESHEFPLLTISLFITMSNFVMLFSGIRQSLTISLGLIAFGFVKKKKPLPYLIIVAVAFLIHNSAFMLLFMYPLYYAKINRKWLLFIIPAMGLVFVFNKPIFDLLSVLISDMYESNVKDTGAYTMLILFILFCVFSFMIPDESKLDEETVGMRNFLLLATCVQMFSPLNGLAMRMGYYYMIFIPILIPKIIRCTSVKWRQVANVSVYVMTVFFLVYFFVDAPLSNSLHTFPYYFFWETVK